MDTYTPHSTSPIKDFRWPLPTDFIFFSLGYTIGLGNFWRFPYVYFKNGSGAFLIPYLICLFWIGLPLLIMEFAVGQFSSGIIGYWMFCPILQGIQILSFVSNFVIMSYYAVILSWTILYFTYAIQPFIPWEECSPPWASKFCKDFLVSIDGKHCKGILKPFPNGTCFDMRTKTLYGIYDYEIASKHNIHKVMASEDFLKYQSLKFGFSRGIEDLGAINWRVCVILAFTWIVQCISLMKGFRYLEKMVYFTVLFPLVYILMLIFFTMAQTGSGDGLSYFFSIDIYQLIKPEVWKEALVQVILSVGLILNGQPSLASHNRFHNNFVVDAIIISGLDLLMSLLCAIAVFSFTGVSSEQMEIPIPKMFSEGITLAFIIYPETLTYFAFARLFIISFFIMLAALGTNTVIISVHTLVADVTEFLHLKRKYQTKVTASLCLTLYTIGFFMTFPGGIYVITLVTEHSGQFLAFIIIILETAAISIYGPRRFCGLIKSMVGDEPLGCVPWKYLEWYLIVSWVAVAPGCMVILLISFFFAESPSFVGAYKMPQWADNLGFLLLEVVPIPLTIFYSLYLTSKVSGSTFKEKILKMTKPHPMYEQRLSVLSNKNQRHFKRKFNRQATEDLYSYLEMPIDELRDRMFTATSTTKTRRSLKAFDTKNDEKDYDTEITDTCEEETTTVTESTTPGKRMSSKRKAKKSRSRSRKRLKRGNANKLTAKRGNANKLSKLDSRKKSKKN